MKYFFELTAGIPVVASTVKRDVAIEGLSQHSASVKPGYIFFVSSPAAEEYIDEAIQNGAVVLCGEKIYDQAPCIAVKNIRRAVAVMSRAFYNYPDRKLSVVGVIGTNGKTTETQILGQIFSYCGFRTAVIGSLGVFIGSERYKNARTTPDSPDFFRYLAEAVEKRVQYVFCEISAHAIYYEKLYGVQCELCVFTNLSRDHLDFFETMEKYKNVKTSYFNNKNMKCAVVNCDDPVGREIIDSSNICSISYGLYHPADAFAIDISYNVGTDFAVNLFDDVGLVHSPLYGEYNVYNLLAALTVGKIYDLKTEDMVRAVLSLGEVEGRFNVINWRAKIVIDYAHTPDGLSKVLACARGLCEGNLFCVFGCGGERDKTKRPLMGKIASELADVVVVTEDNPRSEDPEDIIREIVSGAKKEVFSITDRGEAIRFAMQKALPGDVIVLCGKGAEEYIEKNGGFIPFSDRQVCLDYIGSKICHA